jgi:hypothetical protein
MQPFFICYKIKNCLSFAITRLPETVIVVTGTIYKGDDKIAS